MGESGRCGRASAGGRLMMSAGGGGGDRVPGVCSCGEDDEVIVGVGDGR